MEKAIGGRVRLALTTRTTAENDDDDEKDWEMTLNRAQGLPRVYPG